MQDIDPSRVLPDLIRSEGKAMPMLHYSGPFYSGLLTDLYELTMAAGYVQNHFGARATFGLFVRHLPERRSYLVAAGLEKALDFLEYVHFPDEEISYLRKMPLFGHVSRAVFRIP